MTAAVEVHWAKNSELNSVGELLAGWLVGGRVSHCTSIERRVSRIAKKKVTVYRNDSRDAHKSRINGNLVVVVFE